MSLSGHDPDQNMAVLTCGGLLLTDWWWGVFGLGLSGHDPDQNVAVLMVLVMCPGFKAELKLIFSLLQAFP